MKRNVRVSKLYVFPVLRSRSLPQEEEEERQKERGKKEKEERNKIILHVFTIPSCSEKRDEEGGRGG